MNTWIHSLLQDLEDKLSYLPIADSLQACRETNACLSGYMERYIFQSRKEEVLYFRIFKPRFMAHQLTCQILEGGENLDAAAVAPWLREYYQNGDSRSDGFHFTNRSCHKTDFNLPVMGSSSGWETADKQVARLLAEQWLTKEKNAQNKTVQWA